MESFHEAADMRGPFSNPAAIADRIRREHPYRFAALEREVRWLKRCMKKMGLDPEHARWLL